MATIVVLVPVLGCTAARDNPRTAKGVGYGALGGAAVGAGIGAIADGGRGAAIGAGVGAGLGALAGGLIGNYMDRQARELDAIVAEQRATNDRVTRVEDSIQLSLSSDTLFDTGKADIYPGARDRLARIARNINRHDRTDVLVVGHTDSVGGDDFNQALSEDRAQAVRAVLVAEGVRPGRIRTRGAGERRPVATNSTPEGRAKNRRVEITLAPSDELREEADRAHLDLDARDAA